MVPIVFPDRESGAAAGRRRPRHGPHDAAQSQNGQKAWKGNNQQVKPVSKFRMLTATQCNHRCTCIFLIEVNKTFYCAFALQGQGVV